MFELICGSVKRKNLVASKNLVEIKDNVVAYDKIT